MGCIRKERSFAARDITEQEWMCENTWCELCQQADLGLVDPREYEEDGEIFLERRSRVCGSVVLSTIDERTADGE